MAQPNFTDGFKINIIEQITELCYSYSMADISKPAIVGEEVVEQVVEIRWFKQEQADLTEGRDIKRSRCPDWLGNT